MIMRQVIGLTALAGCAVLAVAGCGTVHAASETAGTTAGAAAAASSPSHPAGSPPVASPPVLSPKQRADADAASILASFAAPPGAVRLSGAPALPGGALRGPVSVPDTADLADVSSWWRVPGQPQAVLSWEKSHLPRQFSFSGTTTAGGGGGTALMSADEFALPAVAGVLSSRAMLVTAASLGTGQTALRVDAQVIWVPGKPASERVPAAAKVVTVGMLPGMIAGTKLPGPATITDPATVARIAALVNGLPVVTPGTYHCPADLGRGLMLTFRATVGGPALAAVTAYTTGCGAASVSIGGKPQLGLSGGAALAQQVLAVAGLHWPGFGGTPSPGGGAPGGVVPGGVMRTPAT